MPTLKKVLRDLLNAAAKQPGVLQPAKLEGGLRLAFKIDDGKTYGKIGRDRVYPSAREWKAVMDALPYYAPVVKPQGRGIGADTRRWLWATWVTPGQLPFDELRVQDEGEGMKDEVGELERPPLQRAAR